MHLQIKFGETKVFTDKPRNLRYERGYEEGYYWGKFNSHTYMISREGVIKELKSRNPKMLKDSWGIGFINGALDGNKGLPQKYPKK